MFDGGDSHLECLIEETVTLNVSTGQFITMGCDSWFQSRLHTRKNDSCLCRVLQVEIMKDKECMFHDCLKVVYVCLFRFLVYTSWQFTRTLMHIHKLLHCSIYYDLFSISEPTKMVIHSYTNTPW